MELESERNIRLCIVMSAYPSDILLAKAGGRERVEAVARDRLKRAWKIITGSDPAE